MTQIYLKYDKDGLDARYTIPISKHADIIIDHYENKSIEELAKKYGVSCSTIQRIISFAYRKRKPRIDEWRKSYDKEKHRRSIQKYRDKKRKLNYAITQPYIRKRKAIEKSVEA